MDPIKQQLLHLSECDQLPKPHVEFLKHLKSTNAFEPKVVYDIGSCVLHWTKEAKRVWPSAEFVLYDAFEPASFLYTDYKHHVGLLSNTNDKIIKFYQNESFPTGSSYYREVGCKNGDFFPENNYLEKKSQTLDRVVAEKGFPYPDLVKIDVQGSEKDIIEGGVETLSKARYLIVEMQHTNYNDGAPMVNITKPYIESLGWKCIAERFSDNGPDADYCFVNTKLV